MPDRIVEGDNGTCFAFDRDVVGDKVVFARLVIGAAMQGLLCMQDFFVVRAADNL